MEDQSVFLGEATRLSPCLFGWNDYVLAGWGTKPRGPIVFSPEEAVLDIAKLNETVTLYAQWAPATPVISPSEATVFPNAFQDVSIACATEGATILFTTDGSDPVQFGRRYAGPFQIYDSRTIRAVAVMPGLHNSGEMSVSLSRGESLSAAADFYGYTMETSAGNPWTVDAEMSHDGVKSVKSGGDGSYLQVAVKGAGTLSFWWRAMCEEPDEGDFYDYGALMVGGAYTAFLAGEDTGWVHFTTNIATTGKHVIRWEYHKDEVTDFAPDCIWVDQVQWVPADGSGATYTTPERVPYSWLSHYGLGESAGCYETAAHGTAANGVNKVWECYVAGLVPTNATDVFRTVISFSGERPTISWEPRLAPEEEARRVYTIYGRESLTEGGWTTPTNSASRFFKVGVEMR